LSEDPETTLTISDGGISAKHPAVEQQAALVGPATGREFNTLKVPIIPAACWRVEDFRFEFDSSVVKPQIKSELKQLAQLLQEHPPASKASPGFPLSVFGHADPTGDDDYNKALSGRRATAVYALLTRRTDLWERLFSRPFGNDKWARPALQMMLDELAASADEPSSEGGGQDGGSESGNAAGVAGDAAEHERDAGKRRALFSAYMDRLCGPDLKVEKEDFLGHGDDAGGKADFQGCGEFNPVLIVSQQDQKQFEQAKNKSARDRGNARNRRVLVLIFCKGSRVDPAKWPCPRATEGTAGCRKRFWSDGEKRRSTRLADQPREFEEKKDTFACRFYNRLVDKSPCEITVKTFDVRLYSPIGRAIPNAPCQVTIGGRKPFNDQADARGIITLRDVAVPATCKIRWGFQPEKGQPRELIYNLELFLKADEDAVGADDGHRKLNNLGYINPSAAENVRSFQRDYGQLTNPPLPITGTLDDTTKDILTKVYLQRADDLRKTQVG
jgi:outer membrane protein OmpA-like peptidoglycan-associated protein